MDFGNNFEVTARIVKDVYAKHKKSGQELNLQLFLLGKCICNLRTGSRITFDGWTSADVQVSSASAIFGLIFTREGKVIPHDNAVQW